jgi:hypothetical protein
VGLSVVAEKDVLLLAGYNFTQFGNGKVIR